MMIIIIIVAEIVEILSHVSNSANNVYFRQLMVITKFWRSIIIAIRAVDHHLDCIALNLS